MLPESFIPNEWPGPLGNHYQNEKVDWTTCTDGSRNTVANDSRDSKDRGGKHVWIIFSIISRRRSSSRSLRLAGRQSDRGQLTGTPLCRLRKKSSYQVVKSRFTEFLFRVKTTSVETKVLLGKKSLFKHVLCASSDRTYYNRVEWVVTTGGTERGCSNSETKSSTENNVRVRNILSKTVAVFPFWVSTLLRGRRARHSKRTSLLSTRTGETRRKNESHPRPFGYYDFTSRFQNDCRRTRGWFLFVFN